MLIREEKKMAIRNIRELGDDILRKNCREVREMTPRLRELIGDMYDTMYEAQGVGLAAPQVGILKRIVVIDVDGTPYTMINPRILESRDTQTGSEGCLSVPGKAGIVTRPAYVKAEAWNEDMERYEVEAEGLLARAICHELDHLDGVMYVDLVEGDIYDVEAAEEDEE
ncbi:MAG TPA: peptide deformylase [Candidatus Merdisoma merdipullorum]|nr:peptide deformylase [Candidatus Merdisoma merdipullorum]